MVNPVSDNSASGVNFSAQNSSTSLRVPIEPPGALAGGASVRAVSDVASATVSSDTGSRQGFVPSLDQKGSSSIKSNDVDPLSAPDNDSVATNEAVIHDDGASVATNNAVIHDDGASFVTNKAVIHRYNPAVFAGVRPRNTSQSQSDPLGNINCTVSPSFATLNPKSGGSLTSRLKGAITNLGRKLLQSFRSQKDDGSQASTALDSNKAKNKATSPETSAVRSDAQKMLDEMKEAHKNGYVF